MESKNPQKKTAAETATILQEKPSLNEKKISDCKHYFGYMSEDEPKKQMPEECMLCTQIIECMVKGNGPARGKP